MGTVTVRCFTSATEAGGTLAVELKLKIKASTMTVRLYDDQIIPDIYSWQIMVGILKMIPTSQPMDPDFLYPALLKLMMIILGFVVLLFEKIGKLAIIQYGPSRQVAGPVQN